MAATQELPAAVVPRTMLALAVNLLLAVCLAVTLLIVTISGALHALPSAGLRSMLPRTIQVEQSSEAAARALGQMPCGGTVVRCAASPGRCHSTPASAADLWMPLCTRACTAAPCGCTRFDVVTCVHVLDRAPFIEFKFLRGMHTHEMGSALCV